MSPLSLLRSGRYSLEWVKDFYTQTGKWWGPGVQEPAVHAARVEAVSRLGGPGAWRILELGSGPGYTAACVHTLCA